MSGDNVDPSIRPVDQSMGIPLIPEEHPNLRPLFNYLLNILQSQPSEETKALLRKNITKNGSDISTIKIIALAGARLGETTLLELIIGKGEEIKSTLGPEICAAAAGAGKLNVLQWARENGCPWDQETLVSAIRGNHFTVAKWAVDNGVPYKWSELYNHFYSVKDRTWIEINVPKTASIRPADKSTAMEISESHTATAPPLLGPGILDLPIDVLRIIIVELPEAEQAIIKEVSRRLRTGVHRDRKITQATVLAAAKHGNTQLIELLLSKVKKGEREKMERLVCDAAARAGKLEVLQWARENHFHWIKQSVTENAAQGGHLEVLKWLKDKNILQGEIGKYAALGGHLHVLEWLKTVIGRYTLRVNDILGALQNGHLAVVNWAVDNGGSYNWQQLYNSVSDEKTRQWIEANVPKH